MPRPACDRTDATESTRVPRIWAGFPNTHTRQLLSTVSKSGSLMKHGGHRQATAIHRAQHPRASSCRRPLSNSGRHEYTNLLYEMPYPAICCHICRGRNIVLPLGSWSIGRLIAFAVFELSADELN